MTHSTSVPFQSIQVAQVFDNYPDEISERLLYLRQLIFETANDIGIDDLQETLKWGEPSYLTQNASTVRVAWRKSHPNEYGMFFNCKTTLVDTFREVYRDQFKYEDNRAIVFQKNTVIDDQLSATLKHCIELSLRYHSIKHLPLLGL